MNPSVTVLGIESSCDDTAVAVLRHRNGHLPEVLSTVVLNQDELHKFYGGVVPEIAARAHAERLDVCTERALHESGLDLGSMDAIAVTAGPGLIGGVLAGVSFAKGLAAGAARPIIGVNHLAGHALTARMTNGTCFPYLSLLVSGGHCQFHAVLSATRFVRLGGTLDDSPGEALDKTARVLGLEQPGGPAIEIMARKGRANRFDFPRPLLGQPGCNMSFSGLKTAMLRAREILIREGGALKEHDVSDLCASFQLAISDTLRGKCQAAIDSFRAQTGSLPRVLAVSGGVAANSVIRQNLESLCQCTGIAFLAPPIQYCTDNGAMIAWVGIERLRQGDVDELDLQVRARWPLDPTSPPLTGHGRRGTKS
ncbi:MAG: tRNA (adenosine(37)-N6)-threonylcarbamoyltransferase complex transferase subunit TsaD [Rhodobacteraceae bacterium]|nr:tRNA (adenosine(37)-N6)-threonylcarbamoyltransferase complex transferase subunit TsaD [Paracoccaceae bacterium]